MTVRDLMSFGQICLVEIGGLPDAVACRINELGTTSITSLSTSSRGVAHAPPASDASVEMQHFRFRPMNG